MYDLSGKKNSSAQVNDLWEFPQESNHHSF